jgi:proteic killer suppression protein
MIESPRSKSLRDLFAKGTSSKIDQRLHKRVLMRLDRLDAAVAPEDMDLPGFGFHELKGKRKGIYSVHVNGPWCATFMWGQDGPYEVDYEQYH